MSLSIVYEHRIWLNTNKDTLYIKSTQFMVTIKIKSTFTLFKHDKNLAEIMDFRNKTIFHSQSLFLF